MINLDSQNGGNTYFSSEDYLGFLKRQEGTDSDTDAYNISQSNNKKL